MALYHRIRRDTISEIFPQPVDHISSGSFHRCCMVKGTEYCFFRSFCSCLKDKIHRIIPERLHLKYFFLAVMRNAVCGRKSNRDIPASISKERTCPAKANNASSCHAAKLAVRKRKICGKYKNHRTLFTFLRRKFHAFWSKTVNSEIAAHAEIRHQDYTDRMLLAIYRNDTGCGSNTAL